MAEFLKRAWTEIHLDRLLNNYNVCRDIINKNAEIMAVVKANAYGHGDSVIAPFLQKLGTKFFAVSNLNEAIHLRNCGIVGEILILGYTPPENAKEIIEYNVIQTVTEFSHANDLSKTLFWDKCDKKMRVHIKVDTGMGRIGLRGENAEVVALQVEEIIGLENLSVEGIFTHLSVADSEKQSDILYTKSQKNFFLEVKNKLLSNNIVFKYYHYLNSAAACEFDENSDFARLGIVLYGLKPDSYSQKKLNLKPVMELKSIVTQVKTVEKGEFISYGRTFETKNNVTKIATLAIGYADGYSRLLSGKSDVLINGKRCRSIGRICMDQMMVDVTGVDVKVGNVATHFGIDGDEEISVDDLAVLYNTIGYEIVCGISKRVPRIVKNGGKVVEVIEYYR